MIGTTVGNYRIVERLGDGGMGAVFRAVDEMLDREVAIKVLKAELARNAALIERFAMFVERAQVDGRISAKEKRELLESYRSGMAGYTYFES